jgi:hydrogenase maturation protein HypF
MAVMTARIRVGGTVQGVGFRPFVHTLATRLELAGFVGNDGDGVFAEVEGDTGVVTDFARRIAAEAPPLATVESLTLQPVPATGEPGFTIVAGRPGSGEAVILPDARRAGRTRIPGPHPPSGALQRRRDQPGPSHDRPHSPNA